MASVVDRPGKDEYNTYAGLRWEERFSKNTMHSHTCNVGDRERVSCDEDCGAFFEPGNLAEALATVRHYQEHKLSGGCSGCGS